MPARSDEPPGLNRPLSEIKAELFKALGHPARVRALEDLADGERTVGELQPLVRIEASHLSQQLGCAGPGWSPPAGRARRFSTPLRTPSWPSS
jgi:hypothetical protein